MLPTSDDWAAAAPVRSNRSRLLAGFAALLVGALLIGVAIRFAWPAPTGPTRADGEQRLRAIVLPDGWQRSTIAYNDSFWSPETEWSEEILASSGDLDEVADTVGEAIRTSGFISAGCLQLYPDDTSCEWYARDYALHSSVRGSDPLLKAPCPTGMSECARIWLSLTHRTRG